MRWDYAFFQMAVETNFLSFKRGDGRLGRRQIRGRIISPAWARRAAAWRAISYPDVGTGVLAQIQHLVVYSGEHIPAPVGARTKLKQDDIIESMARLRGTRRSPTFRAAGPQTSIMAPRSSGWPAATAPPTATSAAKQDRRRCGGKVGRPRRHLPPAAALGGPAAASASNRRRRCRCAPSGRDREQRQAANAARPPRIRPSVKDKPTAVSPCRSRQPSRAGARTQDCAGDRSAKEFAAGPGRTPRGGKTVLKPDDRSAWRNAARHAPSRSQRR